MTIVHGQSVGSQWQNSSGISKIEWENAMHSGSKQKISAALSTLLLLIALPARADLYSAQSAYKKGDFAAAFNEYKDLAEVGQPTAQLDLAIMYARGEGVDQNNVYAHAWASLAGQNGEAKGKSLAETLEPKLTPTSLRISAEIQEKYGQAALNARLMPHFLKGREYSDRDPVRPSKPFIPDYPLDAQQQGIQGEAYVEFVVAPDGHPRVPRILYVVPAGVFDAAIRESVMRSVYLPARVNGQPISATVSQMYRFVAPQLNIRDYGGLEKRVRDTELKAQSGDPNAQMLYGMMLAGLPQLNSTYDRALPWFLKAAQAGAPYAQYQVGTGLLQGRGCQCESSKGEIWLQKAAQADQADAQVSLAEFLLKNDADPESVGGAVEWLERATKQNNKSAKLLLSAVLAASPLTNVRDPHRALTMIDSIEHEYRIDPSYWEIRAAASASQGDFKTAARTQEKAVSKASHLGWDLTLLQQRQSLYDSGKPWTGNLLAF
jgi:TonB family protein